MSKNLFSDHINITLTVLTEPLNSKIKSNIVDCGSLRKPSNGEVTYSRTTYAAEATYKCDTSYNIVGDSFRTCNRDGKWTGIEPRCDSRSMYSMISLNSFTAT